MLRATKIVRRAAVKADRVAETVILDHEARSRAGAPLKGDQGTEFVLDLDKAVGLADGDAVELEDGRLVQVKARPERLLEVRAENPLRLLKTAYLLGSRHAAVEMTADALFVEDDPAIAEMVRGQGCRAVPVERPFQPERAGAHDCGHDHGHGHSHGHGHHHDHGHAHEAHDHGPGAGHASHRGHGH